MRIIGVIIFCAGWIYAMGEFGFFLGLGLGWIPALFFAFIILIAIRLLDILLRIIIGKMRRL